jgi:hypothetical protein
VDLVLKGSLAMFADCVIEGLVEEGREGVVLVGGGRVLVVGEKGALAEIVV